MKVVWRPNRFDQQNILHKRSTALVVARLAAKEQELSGVVLRSSNDVILRKLCAIAQNCLHFRNLFVYDEGCGRPQAAQLKRHGITAQTLSKDTSICERALGLGQHAAWLVVCSRMALKRALEAKGSLPTLRILVSVDLLRELTDEEATACDGVYYLRFPGDTKELHKLKPSATVFSLYPHMALEVARSHKQSHEALATTQNTYRPPFVSGSGGPRHTAKV